MTAKMTPIQASIWNALTDEWQFMWEVKRASRIGFHENSLKQMCAKYGVEFKRIGSHTRIYRLPQPESRAVAERVLFMREREAYMKDRPTPESYGCGDHSCVFQKPAGMGTNGGCRCLKAVKPEMLRIEIERRVLFMKNDLSRGDDNDNT